MFLTDLNGLLLHRFLESPRPKSPARIVPGAEFSASPSPKTRGRQTSLKYCFDLCDSIAAWAAASLATGRRKGEHDT